MKIVNWSFITSHLWDIDHPKSIEPLVKDLSCPYEPLSRHISLTRKGATYLKCPAHTDFLKNTFVFTAPFDLNLNLDISDNNKKIFVNNISQEIFDNLIDLRFLNDCQNIPILGIDWLNVFTSKSPIMMQVFPAFMHENDFIRKTNVIPGEFNIGKWTRPIELVFESKSLKQEICIKKGDALAYFKFNDQDLIKLIEEETPWSEVELCNKIRELSPFKPLKERYKSLNEERIRKGNV